MSNNSKFDQAHSSVSERDEDIATIGCGFSLPGGASTLDGLWNFLINGGDGIRDLPDGRWSRDLYDPEPRQGYTYVRRGGFIDGLDLIDRAFFETSPREAKHIDPQQHLLVETAYEALESAGLPLKIVSEGRTGVFVGLSSNYYAQLTNDDVTAASAYTTTGGALSIAANRISYVLDLKGPSAVFDTACSSGLTALDGAVNSLRAGSCDIAIVGAANALLRAEPFVTFSQAEMLSRVGQCRAFDADRAVFVRAEGAVAFVLKPLSRALADHNPMLGVVRGSDTNNDGRTEGLSLPSEAAQARLIRRVIERHELDVNDFVYLEAHGTGTSVGDPIEARSIGRSIAFERASDSPLPIGSIKSNIWHLEPASGLAGLAKALLCFRHRQIPPSIHFDTPFPNIDFAGLRLKVVDRLMPLPETQGPAPIGKNSFGFGGSNAHVIASEPPVVAAKQHQTLELPSPWILVSGRSEEAMRKNAENLALWLADERPSLDLLAANLLTRRTLHAHRAAIWGDSAWRYASYDCIIKKTVLNECKKYENFALRARSLPRYFTWGSLRPQ